MERRTVLSATAYTGYVWGLNGNVQVGVGQAHTYSYGQSLANSKTTETFLFAGVEASTLYAGANASAFYATPSSFGISLSGNLLAFQGGVGGT
jgi:hypothetical protein